MDGRALGVRKYASPYSVSISAQRLVSAVFVFSCLIPWVSFGTNNLDSQPWPLIFGLIVLAVFLGKFAASQKIKYSAFLASCGFFVTLFFSNYLDFLTARAFYNYFSFFVVLIVFLSILMRYGPPIRTIKIVNYLWLMAALIELIQPDLIAMLGKARTTAGRGVTSLAPEPTFFAIYLIFSSLLLFQLRGGDYKSDKSFHIINFLSTVILAKSSMGILMLFSIVSIYLVYSLIRVKPLKSGLKWMFFLTTSIAILASLLSIYFGSTRVFSLLEKLIDVGPILIFKLDASMNVRIEHVIFSFHGFFNNYFLPGGLDTFMDNRTEIVGYYGDFFWYGVGDNKIMSWVGDWLYSLGIFGLLALLFLFSAAHNGTRKSFWFLILTAVLLMTAVPLAFPLVPMLFASLIYAKKLNRTLDIAYFGQAETRKVA